MWSPLKGIFDELDKEEEGFIFVADFLDVLRNLNSDIDSNEKVKGIFDDIHLEEINRCEFARLIKKLEEADWMKRKGQYLSDSALKRIFLTVDVDKSGSISRIAVAWVREQDADKDGRMNFQEFKTAVNKMKEENCRMNDSD